MLKAWGADPTTTVRQVTKNHYLFEFNAVKILIRLCWKVSGRIAEVDNAVVWVLLMNLPVNAFKDEGLLIIAKSVGELVSAPVKGFVHGRRFVKVKVLIPVGEPVKDSIKVTHPSLGQITVYCAYEKVSRICLFCGKLGHEMVGCQDHARLALLIKKPGQQSRFKIFDILSAKKGAWLTNPALAPGLRVQRQESNSHSATSKTAAHSGSKRNFDNSDHEERSDNQPHVNKVAEHQVGLGEGVITVISQLETYKRGVISKRPRPAGPNMLALDI